MNHRVIVGIASAALLAAGAGLWWATGTSDKAARPTLRPRAQASAGTAPRMVTVEVGGMTCAACVAKIESKLSKVPGVTAVRPQPDRQRFVVLCSDATADTALTAAVRRAGPGYLGMVVAD